jgi:integrase
LRCRYRFSKTTDRREAVAKEKELIAAAMQGALAASKQDFASLPFTEAADRYSQGRKLELAEASQAKERQLLVKPRVFFGAMRPNKIKNEQLRGYRQWRAEQGVGPAIQNMEMGVIRRIFQRAKLWHTVSDGIRLLKEPKSIGQALSHEQAAWLMEVAASNSNWQNAYSASVLTMNTTMRGMEVKGLRWRDIDFKDESLKIRKSKTHAGVRVIPMNSRALDETRRIEQRALALKAGEPDHFVLPACEHGHIDPTRPMKSWRTAWRALTDAIKCPSCERIQAPTAHCRNRRCKADLKNMKSSLAGLRFHDLRHHAITELAESQASDATIMAIAGHVSRHMLERYSHVRQTAKRVALDGIGKTKAATTLSAQTEEGYGTNHDTNQPMEGEVPPYVIENMVGTRRLELLTSTVSR